MPEQIALLEPCAALRSDFLRMLAEYEWAGEDYDEPLAHENYEAYLSQLAAESRGIHLPPGIVPMTSYWLVRDQRTLLGVSKLRHYLTPLLEHHGGHIGYLVRPSERHKGYGTLILALTLEKARLLGLRRVRITCDSANVGSVRIIEKNGGVLDAQLVSRQSGNLISQYWIQLS